MTFTTLLIRIGLLVNLLACQKNDEPTTVPGKGTLTVTFDGKTQVYTDVRISEGKRGSVTSLDLNVGSSDSDYLMLTVFGTQAGTYPYKQTINEYRQVSQIDYKTGGTVFNNYFTKVCPDQSGYYSTTGTVKIDEYTKGKMAKGLLGGFTRCQ